ncbi:MAG: ATP-binding cassette domain-containing protein [Thermoguttaceae bacterium]|jgi:cobalt/nickel transport system ATP-binding protein
MSASQGPWAIEADGVCYAYPNGVEAVAGLTVRAAPAEIVAVLGPNGAGKTTLMKLLVRLLRPQAGQVRLGGADIARLRPDDLYRRVGMVLQNPADQLFATSVREDVAFGPRNLGLAEGEVRLRVEEALAVVDALALADRPIHHLSFGQQKRVGLAGVLAMQPEVLVLDDPLAGLDPAGESRMIDLLLDINRRRKATLLFSTHSVDLLPLLAQRVYVLVSGRVDREGLPQEVFRDPEALARAGLRLPLVAQVFQGLDGRQGSAAGELPLSVAAARKEVLRWMVGF